MKYNMDLFDIRFLVKLYTNSSMNRVVVVA